MTFPFLLRANPLARRPQVLIMSIIVMTDDDFEKNMKRLADQFHPLLAASFQARDTAQREAVEAWKAAHAREATALAQAWEQRDAAQVKLAQVQVEIPDLRANMTKALDLLQVLTSTKYTDRAFVEAVDEADEMPEQLRGMVVLKDQAEQQEAHGAQAGDDVIKLFERIIRQSPADLDRATEDNPWYQVMASEVREFAAALAAHPAPGESVATLIRRRSIGGPSVGVVRFDASRLPEGALVDLYTAPPAAAHGDEVVAVVGTVPDGSGFKSLDFKVELQDLPDGTRLYAKGAGASST